MDLFSSPFDDLRLCERGEKSLRDGTGLKCRIIFPAKGPGMVPRGTEAAEPILRGVRGREEGRSRDRPLFLPAR